MTDVMDEGHCGLPTDELVLLAKKLLEVPAMGGTFKELADTLSDIERDLGHHQAVP
jgi:exodeoxyribonuclease V alpha subunit